MMIRTWWATCSIGAAVVIGTACGTTPAPEAQGDSASVSQLRQLAYIKASNTDGFDHFACGGSLPGHIGNALVISGDGRTMAVGAPHESSAARGINGSQSDNSLYNSGAAYVYVRSGDTWTQQAYIKASNPGQSDTFGISLALSSDGNTLAVAAPWEASAATGVNGNQDDDSLPQAGAVYVFTREGETWSQHAYVKASNTGRQGVGDDRDGDQFGFSLALSGDGNTLATGAVSEDSDATGVNGNQSDDSATSSGAVYVFARAGNSWAQQAYIKGANTGEGDLFGYGVALSSDGASMVVGGYDEDGSGRGVNPVDDNGVIGSGAIYAFDRTGDTWRQSGYFKGSRSQRNDALGYTVAISADGNTIAAGAGDESCLNGGVNPSGCDIDTFPPEMGAGSAGAAYVWVRSGSSWTEQAFIKASNPELTDWFAVRLALSGDGRRLVVGAPMEDSEARGFNGPQNNDAVDSGAAYIFSRTGSTWSQDAFVKASNADPFDEFGSSVAVSGDGKTIAVGARMESGASMNLNGDQDDNDAGQSGAVYVFGQ
ncbi:MAG: integrin [Acidobacteria bacterium]|nr:integrin [Acidobacteriota bacterium]